MSYYIYGVGPADVTTDMSGAAVGGIEGRVFSDRSMTNRIYDLQSLSGDPLPKIVTSTTIEEASVPEMVGRIPFRAPDTFPALYFYPGYGEPWLLIASDVWALVPAAMEQAATAETKSLEAIGRVDDLDTTVVDFGSTVAEAAADASQAKSAVLQMQAIAPTRDELTQTVYVPAMVDSGTLTAEMVWDQIVWIWVAPFDAEIVSFDLVFDTLTVDTVNDTNFFTMYAIQRSVMENRNSDSIVTWKDTSFLNGEAIAAGEPWSFANAEWREEKTLLDEGCVLGFKVKKTGTVDNIPLPVTITFRYQPR